MGMRHLHLVIKDGKTIGWTHCFQAKGYELRKCTLEETQGLPQLKKSDFEQ